MKRIIAILILTAVTASSLFAQKATSYKVLKQTYDPYEYVKDADDPYSTAWMGIFSFFAPGTGQLIANEPGRGWAFLGGAVILSSIADGAIDTIRENITLDSENNIVYVDEKKAKSGLTTLVVSALAELGLGIWSSIDAVRVAKVKNMYYRDSRGKFGVKASLQPSLELAQTPSGLQPAPGMSLAFRF